MIKKPLSKEILFGKLTNGGIVEIFLEEDELKLHVADILPVKKVKNESPETSDV